MFSLLLLGLGGLASSAHAQQESEASEERQREAQNDDGAEAEPPERRAAKLLKGAQRLYHEGKWYRAREVYDRAYETAPGDSEVRVHAGLGRSTLLWEQGNYSAARSDIDAAMDLAEKLDLDSAIGRLLLTLGHIEASEGKLSSAEQTLDHCVQLAAEQNDAVFGPLCELNHRLVRKLQGKSVAPEASYREALAELESVDSPLTVGLSLSKTAELYADGGQRGRAVDLLNRAGKQYEKAGSIPAQARNRMLKARMLQETGEWTRARKMLEGIAGTFREMGSKPALVDAYGLLGNDAQHRRAWEEARKYYRRALEVARATGSPQLIAKVEVAMCELGAETGRYDGASEQCTSAIESFRNLGMWKLVATARASMGRAAQTAGELESAREALMSAVETLEERVHPRLRQNGELAHNLANLCQVEMHMQLEGALYRCREALDRLDGDRDSRDMLASTRYARGVAAANEGHPDEAVEQLERAAEMFLTGQSTDYRRFADAKLRLGMLHEQGDRPEKASEAYSSALQRLDGTEEGEATRSMAIKLRTKYAQVLLGRAQWKRAVSELETLVEDSKSAGDLGTRAWALSAMARAQSRSGETEAARESLERALPLAKRAGDDGLVETVESNLESLSE